MRPLIRFLVFVLPLNECLRKSNSVFTIAYMNIMNNTIKSFSQYCKAVLMWLTAHGIKVTYESTTKTLWCSQPLHAGVQYICLICLNINYRHLATRIFLTRPKPIIGPCCKWENPSVYNEHVVLPHESSSLSSYL